MIIGITGTIGSGKSTVLSILKSLGYLTFDADAYTHHLLANDSTIRKQLIAHFGTEILNTNNQIDRPALAKKIFLNEPDRLFLENLLHPLIQQAWLSFKEQNTHNICFAEVPLLFEKNYASDFDKTLCIITDQSTAHKRLSQKELTIEAIQQRERLQLPQDEKINRANYVILNSGSLDFLELQIKDLISVLKAL